MSDRKQYWSNHLEKIAQEGVTTKAYAKREGLSVTTLYYWRKHLKEKAHHAERGTATPQARCLTPVQITTEHAHGAGTLLLARGVRLELAVLPSPEWLVELAAAQSARIR